MNKINVGTFAQKPFWTLVTHDFKAFEYEGNHYNTDFVPKVGTFREMADIYHADPSSYLGIALAGEPYMKPIYSPSSEPKTRDYSPEIQSVVDTGVDFEKYKSKPEAGVKPAIPERYKVVLDHPVQSYDDRPNSYYSESIIQCSYSSEAFLVFVGSPGADPNVKDVELIQEKHEKLLVKIDSNTTSIEFAKLYYRADISSLGKEADHDQGRWKLIYELSKWTNFDADLLEELFQGSAMHHPGHEVMGKDNKTLLQRTIHKILSTRPIFHRNEIEGFLKFHYNCRFNEVTGKPEIINGDAYEEITDFVFNSMLRDVINKGGKISSQYLRQLLTSDLVDRYNPFTEYFKSLPAGNPDSDKDYIGELAAQVQVHDQSYWEWCLKKWLVGAVATALDTEKTNQQVLILCGSQGAGKSMFLESLLPERLSTYYFSGVLDPANKDSLSYLAECFFINLDELDSLNRGKEAALKELITKSVIKYRRPYGTFNQNYTRVASFMGSINHEGILSDTSGSRRYLVHKVKSINYRHNLDMDLVYSQAYALYKQGFKYWFAGKDIDRIHAENRKYELSTVEEEMLVKEFKQGSADDATSEKLSATDILKQLHGGKLPSNSTSAAIKLGQAMVKQGFTYQMVNGSKKWLVKPAWQTQTKKGGLWGG